MHSRSQPAGAAALTDRVEMDAVGSMKVRKPYGLCSTVGSDCSQTHCCKVTNTYCWKTDTGGGQCETKSKPGWPGQELEGTDTIVSVDSAVFVTFNLHAREWITGMSGVYTVESLIEKVRQDSASLAGTEVVLMPMANPDGFYYSTQSTRMHRKNMANACTSSNRGVDLNRNFPSYWNRGGSSSDSCSDVYHGPSAGSEPETQGVKSVMEEAPMSIYID